MRILATPLTITVKLTVIAQKHFSEVFYKKGVLRYFAIFTGKHLCQSLFFNKIAGLRPATLLTKKPWHRCFSVNFATFLRTPIFLEHLRWLLLIVVLPLFSDLYVYDDTSTTRRAKYSQ